MHFLRLAIPDLDLAPPQSKASIFVLSILNSTINSKSLYLCWSFGHQLEDLLKRVAEIAWTIAQIQEPHDLALHAAVDSNKGIETSSDDLVICVLSKTCGVSPCAQDCLEVFRQGATCVSQSESRRVR